MALIAVKNKSIGILVHEFHALTVSILTLKSP